MADLYQIIDLDPLLNPSATNGGTVNGGIGPDLHVVVDLDDPYLRDLEVILRRMGKTESIGANDDTGMDDHPPANAAARIHNHAGWRIVSSPISTSLPMTTPDFTTTPRAITHRGPM